MESTMVNWGYLVSVLYPQYMGFLQGMCRGRIQEVDTTTLLEGAACLQPKNNYSFMEVLPTN